jgi:hypothetical protein
LNDAANQPAPFCVLTFAFGSLWVTKVDSMDDTMENMGIKGLLAPLKAFGYFHFTLMNSKVQKIMAKK